jgi:hypothetical protein
VGIRVGVSVGISVGVSMGMSIGVCVWDSAHAQSWDSAHLQFPQREARAVQPLDMQSHSAMWAAWRASAWKIVDANPK